VIHKRLSISKAQNILKTTKTQRSLTHIPVLRKMCMTLTREEI